MRTAIIERNTNETQIQLKLNIDECKPSRIATGIGFFDHMLNLFARHCGLTLELDCKGDLYVDCHHTVEDCGIALGQALAKCLEDKGGLTRYGSAIIPMDEALLQAVVDISGRSYLVYRAQLPPVSLNGYDAEMTEEFFRAVAYNAKLTLHINMCYGSNTHHIIEGMFKAFAHALRQAMQRQGSEILSTKGSL